MRRTSKSQETFEKGATRVATRGEHIMERSEGNFEHLLRTAAMKSQVQIDITLKPT